MINGTLLKQTIRENRTLWLVVTGVQTFLLVVMGLTVPSVAMTAMTYYQLLPSIMIAIYTISIGNALISQQVDKGTMAYVLSTPITRASVTLTQAVFFAGSLLAMFTVSSGAHAIAVNFSSAGLKVADFEMILKLNLGLFVMALAFSGIVFCASCIFNLSKNTVAVGGGLVCIFLLMPIVAMFSADFNWLKNLSLATLYNPMEIATGASDFIWKFLILGAVGLATYVAGSFVFARRDLPL